MKPVVSICIPTYRQTFLLRENLNSIVSQTYKNIEVIISDDSPGKEVLTLVKEYEHLLPLKYYKNFPSLGSPANWNAVLEKAQGDYILLLHHDDKFSNKNALNSFLCPFFEDESIGFVFGRNETIDELSKGESFPTSYFHRLYQNPSLLITLNVLGAPSNVLIKKDVLLSYDPRYKWIVDVEYYTRFFETGMKFSYIDERLIITGRHEGQITNECIDNKDIVVYENVLYAIDHISQVRSVRVFDFYWRLLRNNKIRHLTGITETGIDRTKIPLFIQKITSFQRTIPSAILQIGIVSKVLMALTYFFLKQKSSSGIR